MHVIARRTLREFWMFHADAEQTLKAWYHEASKANWESFSDIKAKFRSADTLQGNRVIFNIKGNTYRLVVRINYASGTVFIRFIGSHADYDKFDARRI